jgi:hypothetical protein
MAITISGDSPNFTSVDATTITGVTSLTASAITGVTSIASGAADTPVILGDSGTNYNTCRAWVNFNGTGTVAIRADFNVSSITDGGTGLYTVNLTTAMPDANYACIYTNGGTSGTGSAVIAATSNRTTSTIAVAALNNSTFGLIDVSDNNVAFFR